MFHKTLMGTAGAAAIALLLMGSGVSTPVVAQEQQASTVAEAPAPLSADEMEVLVARIALYPDELIAVITGASLYPLQIVEAARYLDQYAKDKSLKPKESWDGSVISLLNYPDVVKMMSDDLEWTQALGDAIAYQQKDVLVAIQQLRDEAVAKGVIKTDDKMQVVEENDNVVIKSANPEVIYVPQYEPQMLYEPDYAWQPISYYPDPYPNYWYPGATFFAGAVTGAIWAAAVDWDDWGVWGGDWDGGDIDIDCNDCFNNRDFNGKVNFNDVDWKNIDRSKINIDRDQLNKLDRDNIKNKIERNGNNADSRPRPRHQEARPGRQQGARQDRRDERRAQEHARRAEGPGRPGCKQAGQQARHGQPARRQARRGQPPSRQARQRATARPASRSLRQGPTTVRRSPRGSATSNRGKATKVNSNRGHKSMGGGHRGGGGHKQVRRRGGGGGGGAWRRARRRWRRTSALREREDRTMTKMFSTTRHTGLSRMRPSAPVCAAALAPGMAAFAAGLRAGGGDAGCRRTRDRFAGGGLRSAGLRHAGGGPRCLQAGAAGGRFGRGRNTARPRPGKAQGRREHRRRRSRRSRRERQSSFCSMARATAARCRSARSCGRCRSRSSRARTANGPSTPMTGWRRS